MLDKRSAKMMQSLLRLCEDGSYKIIEIGDLIKGMLPRYKTDADGIANIIKFLSNNELIDVKYSDDKVYCIAILPKGRVVEEAGQQKKQGNSINRWFFVAMLAGCFIGAFLGSVAAELVREFIF